MFRLKRSARFSGEGGNVAILFALVAPIISLMMAFAVDLGVVSLQKREMQSVTDLAAIIAAANMSQAEEKVLAMLSENGISDTRVMTKEVRPIRDIRFPMRAWVEVVKGHYLADVSRPASERFVAGGEPYNAVQVTLVQPGRYYIMNGVRESPMIVTTGIAHATAEAAFSVGSRLARVEGGVLNALLGSLLGSEISLNVMDYNALLAADISLLQMLDILSTDLNLTAVNYEDILDTRINVASLAAAIRQSGGLTAEARAALGKLERNAGALGAQIRLSDAIDLGVIGKLAPDDGREKPGVHVPVMPLLTAALTAAKGEHQVALDLGANVPGLLKTTVDLRIGERPQRSPWLRMSGPNAVLTTAQTRLKVEVEVPGLGLLLGSNVRIPLYVEVASAEARLEQVSCRPGGANQPVATIEARPSVARVMIGTITRNDFERFGRTMQVTEARIVRALLLDVYARADVRVGNERSTSLPFTQADIDARRVKTATTRNFTSSLLGSALRDLQVRIEVGPLSLVTPGLVQAALATTLTPVLDPVDGIVYNLLSVLGVSLGEADIRVHGVSCRTPALVQ